MANVVLRPSAVELAELGPQYKAVAKSLTHGDHYIGIQAGDRPDPITEPRDVALVVHFLDSVPPLLLTALVHELTRRLRRRGRGRREAVVCGPDGKVLRRIPLNS